MWMNVMCRIHVSTTATTSWAPSSASVTRDTSWHKTRFPVKVAHTQTHAHMHIRSLHTSSYLFSCLCVQTLMNVAFPATCVSISVSTTLEVTPVSVQRDINSRDTGYVKVRLLWKNKIQKNIPSSQVFPLSFSHCSTCQNQEWNLLVLKKRKGLSTNTDTLCRHKQSHLCGFTCTMVLSWSGFLFEGSGAPSNGLLPSPPLPFWSGAGFYWGAAMNPAACVKGTFADESKLLYQK